MIYKGLNDEDASFLGFVAKKQAEIDQKRFDDESEELQEYRVRHTISIFFVLSISCRVMLLLTKLELIELYFINFRTIDMDMSMRSFYQSFE